MTEINEHRRAAYAVEMRRVSNLLSDAVSIVEVDKVHVLRLLGHGLSLLLAAQVEAFGGDPDAPVDDPRQLSLFTSDSTRCDT